MNLKTILDQGARTDHPIAVDEIMNYFLARFWIDQFA
jgi:hypothetical protein